MKKNQNMMLLGVCLLFFPVSIYAAGNRDVSLDIENNTGTLITQVIVTELKSGGMRAEKPEILIKSIEHNTSTVINLKRETFYDIVLINEHGRHYAKEKSQLWNEKSAKISFERSDTQDVSLNIVNNTGTHITQIVITELSSTGDPAGEPEVYNRSIANNESTEILLKRNTLYGIVLINTGERQYAKNRQAWDVESASIDFARRDIQDRNIWDTTIRILLWPINL